MPLSNEKAGLLDRVATALRISGWQVLWLNEDHPAKARLINGSRHLEVWIHIWKLTAGGRSGTRPFERRIQPTGLNGRFKASTGMRTLILGWSDEAEVFAAFDYQYHSGAIGSSSSIQTDIHALEAAANDGLGIGAKASGELSIAIRPDMFGIYLEHGPTLHKMGDDQSVLDALRQMACDPLALELDDLPASRRKVMKPSLLWLRDRRFSEAVLNAYAHQCALCGIQLRLLDAAHILPVAHPESNDKVTNGVALCASHHRAYDAALVAFDEDYSVMINPVAVAALTADQRGGGFAAFRQALGPAIQLPSQVAHHPSRAMIAKANALRGWV